MKLTNLKKQTTYCLAALVPKKKNRWSFGAWMGGRFSDNPKFFLDYMAANHPENEYFVITDEPDSVDKTGYENVTFVKRGTKEARKIVRSSKFVVMGHGSVDFDKLNWIGGAKKLQFWHGVAWKNIGNDTFKPSGNALKDAVRRFNMKWAYKLEIGGDFYVAPSEEYGRVLGTAFGATEKTLIYAGQPRNEMLFDKEKSADLKKRIFSELGINDPSIRLITYLPTFRDSGTDRFSFFEHKDEVSALSGKCVIVEKGHFADKNNADKTGKSTVVYDGRAIDTQELMAAADMLITDYSSCFFDFLIKDKPIIQFIYDYEFYANDDRGLYYPVEEVDCGHVAYDKETVVKMLEDYAAHDWSVGEDQLRVKEKFITFETYNNSEVFYNKMMERLR